MALVQVAEQAALACWPLVGHGDKNAADDAAVRAMRAAFAHVPICGRVVIGEGEMDEAPMLYIGEEVGSGHGVAVDIAVDPLEGTKLAADDAPGAICTLAAAPAGGLLHAPDIYMQKLAAAPWVPPHLLDLDQTPAQILHAVAAATGRSVTDMTVCLLQRERHASVIASVREAGARIRFLSDGDVSGVLFVVEENSGVDFYMGSGGAPEGVLAAAALRCLNGHMRARLMFEDDAQRERARSMGMTNPDAVLTEIDMVPHDAVFIATGVTDGPLAKGPRRSADGKFVTLETFITHAATRTVRRIRSTVPDTQGDA